MFCLPYVILFAKAFNFFPISEYFNLKSRLPTDSADQSRFLKQSNKLPEISQNTHKTRLNYSMWKKKEAEVQRWMTNVVVGRGRPDSWTGKRRKDPYWERRSTKRGAIELKLLKYTNKESKSTEMKTAKNIIWYIGLHFPFWLKLNLVLWKMFSQKLLIKLCEIFPSALQSILTYKNYWFCMLYQLALCYQLTCLPLDLCWHLKMGETTALPPLNHRKKKCYLQNLQP